MHAETFNAIWSGIFTGMIYGGVASTFHAALWWFLPFAVLSVTVAWYAFHGKEAGRW